MPNMKRGQVGYRPFEGRAVLQDGLLAVARPGGEVQQALANALFGVAETIRPYAEATAVRKGREAGQQAALAGHPTVDIQGGDRGPDQVLPREGGYPTPGSRLAGDGLAPLKIGNQGAIRNKPIQPALASNVRRAVTEVYGDGYTVELFSGGQDGKRRTGSTRHDHGGAGDFKVIDPNGKVVSGDALGPLGQYWLANKLGGAGMEMAGGGIHLDLHTDRAPTWNYADKGGQYTPAQQAAVAAGLRGEQPKVKGGKGAGVKTVIQAAAARYGVPAGLMMVTAELESGLDPNAKNPSGAEGLYQLMDDTAAQYGVDNRRDVYQSADGAARLFRDNRAYLLTKLKREPTWGELYLAHQQGAGGATKLLANPAARAVDVVGANAVLQNGGNADMTAGEFAALWTTKIDSRRAGADGKALPYDPGLGAMPTIDLDPAYDIVPGERSALSISASGGMPALTGRDTLFGRAHDQVVTETYSARLQDEMLNKVDDLTTKYADDPQGLAGALRELKDQQLADVPPAVALDYEQAFSRVQRRAVREVQKAFEGKIKKQQEDEWYTSGSGYEEALGRASVGLEPGDEDGLQTMAAHAQRLKQHYREGVARGFMTPRQAATAAQNLDSDVASQWYIAQARDAAPEDIEDLRATLEADYADGKLKGVDARGWAKIDTALKRSAADKTQEREADAAKLAKATDRVLGKAALGYQIAPEELTALRQAASKVDGGEDMVAGAEDVLEIAEVLRNEPVGAAEEKLKQLKERMGKTPTDEQVVLIGKAEQLVAESRKALATDLLGYAERAGVIETAGSLADVKSAADLEGLIGLRTEAAEKAARHFGVSEQVFRPGEAKALEDMVMADPETGAAMAASLITGSGDKVGMVLKEFGQNAPVLAGAGAILAGGGDAVAARDALAGGGKDADGKAYSSKGWQTRKEAGLKATGLALIFNQDDERRVLDTAERIAKKRIADAGLEPDSDEATAIMDKAVNEAAGALYDASGQWGGFADYDPGFWADAQRVAVPNTIRADKLGDVIDALRDDDFATGVKPQGGVARLQDLWPVLTADGYVFVDFDADGGPVPLGGDDGKPFVLPLGGMGPKLGARVPGAFRGY